MSRRLAQNVLSSYVSVIVICCISLSRLLSMKEALGLFREREKKVGRERRTKARRPGRLRSQFWCVRLCARSCVEVRVHMYSRLHLCMPDCRCVFLSVLLRMVPKICHFMYGYIHASSRTHARTQMTLVEASGYIMPAHHSRPCTPSLAAHHESMRPTDFLGMLEGFLEVCWCEVPDNPVQWSMHDVRCQIRTVE